MQDSLRSPSDWPLEFEAKRRDIIQLWDACNVPLIRRTYFFLLFQGDPADSVYVEVELRRLSFLKSALSHGSKLVIDGQIFTHETRYLVFFPLSFFPPLASEKCCSTSILLSQRFIHLQLPSLF